MCINVKAFQYQNVITDTVHQPPDTLHSGFTTFEKQHSFYLALCLHRQVSALPVLLSALATLYTCSAPGYPQEATRLLCSAGITR